MSRWTIAMVLAMVAAFSAGLAWPLDVLTRSRTGWLEAEVPPTSLIELDRMRSKLRRLREEVQRQMVAAEGRRERERAWTVGGMPSCGQCDGRAAVQIVVRRDVLYFCFDHADVHYRRRFAAQDAATD